MIPRHPGVARPWLSPGIRGGGLKSFLFTESLGATLGLSRAFVPAAGSRIAGLSPREETGTSSYQLTIFN